MVEYSDYPSTVLQVVGLYLLHDMGNNLWSLLAVKMLLRLYKLVSKHSDIMCLYGCLHGTPGNQGSVTPSTDEPEVHRLQKKFYGYKLEYKRVDIVNFFRTTMAHSNEKQRHLRQLFKVTSKINFINSEA